MNKHSEVSHSFLLSHFHMKESYTSPFLNVTPLAGLVSASLRKDVFKHCLLSPPWLNHSTTADLGGSHRIKPGLLSSHLMCTSWSLEGNFPIMHASTDFGGSWLWVALPGKVLLFPLHWSSSSKVSWSTVEDEGSRVRGTRNGLEAQRTKVFLL